MLPTPVHKLLPALISKQSKRPAGSLTLKSAGGGSINDCFQVITADQEQYFLKVNRADRLPGLFEKESNGLSTLAKAGFRTPAIWACTTVDNYQLLLMEWIPPGVRTPSFWRSFGEQLAKLHLEPRSGFGFADDNYMGALPQENREAADWLSFFTQQRLRPQVQMASRKKLLNSADQEAFERLYTRLSSFFAIEPPSLLHGDLWSGNFLCDESSRPVLIDPAVYAGHRSMDLAMTTLFGGFDPLFYDAYHHHFPLPPNYREQWDICNLYPLLIHLNLFGAGYLASIRSVLRTYC